MKSYKLHLRYAYESFKRAITESNSSSTTRVELNMFIAFLESTNYINGYFELTESQYVELNLKFLEFNTIYYFKD